MRNWMKKLAAHYESAREKYPEDRLIILFDIDGTILDMRYLILFVLRSYDNARGTQFFRTLSIGDITAHESDIERMLEDWEIPLESRTDVLSWYSREYWSQSAMMEAHRPFAGVMEVIRWFQLQPNTFVGLNTGRPETMRAETLSSINRIGKEYKVEFTPDLLYMNAMGPEQDIAISKIDGLRKFCRAGYRVFAFIDNEPETLAAVECVDPRHQVLLLHADTIFKSKRKTLPANSVSGTHYDISELLRNGSLPEHIQFVWKAVNSRKAIESFLASNVEWAECDVRLDAGRGEPVLSHESIQSFFIYRGEDMPAFRETLYLLLRHGKSIMIDLKENGKLLDKVMEIVERTSAPASSLWFNSRIEVIKSAGFRRISKSFPGAIVQCPVEPLVPLILGMPARALEFLDELQDWGINRFSLSCKTAGLHQVMGNLEKWGFNVDICNVSDLESFVRAVLLMPRSITADFNSRLNWLEKLQHVTIPFQGKVTAGLSTAQ